MSSPNSRRTGCKSRGSLSASEMTFASHSCWTLGSVGIQSPRLLVVRVPAPVANVEQGALTGEVPAYQLLCSFSRIVLRIVMLIVVLDLRRNSELFTSNFGAMM